MADIKPVLLDPLRERAGGRRALVGAVYGADGTVLPRTADIALEPIDPSPKRLRAMAAYLSGDIDRIPDDFSPTSWGRGGAPWRRVSQAVLGIGALTVVGSTAWYLVHPDDDHLTPTYDDRKSPAVQVFVGGSVVVGAGVYLLSREPRDTSTPIVLVERDRGLIGLNGRF